MDGQQRQLAASMQARLSLWLSLLIFVSAIATAVFSFQAAFSEAIELQDEQLRQLAGLIDRQNKPSIDHVPEILTRTTMTSNRASSCCNCRRVRAPEWKAAS